MDRADLPGATVVLVRHGSTSWSRRGRFTGRSDIPLDGEGHRQAATAARRIAALAPELIVTSDLLRASGTAAHIRAVTTAPLQLDRRLREERLGGWEGLTRAEVGQRYPDEYAAWLTGQLTAGPNREGLPAVTIRAAAALRDALGRAERCVLVTHSNVLIALSHVLLGLPRDGTVHIASPAPGGHRTFRRTAGGWACSDSAPP